MPWDDVDFEARKVLRRNTKNGLSRTVPPRALNVIKDMPRCDPTTRSGLHGSG
jgi:hypothetical protein